jgi:hypothetical protein
MGMPMDEEDGPEIGAEIGETGAEAPSEQGG